MSRDPCYNKNTWPTFPLWVMLAFIIGACAFFGSVVANKRIEQLQRHVDYIHDELNRKVNK